MQDAGIRNVIELRVEDVAQLFHALDSLPFREWDLDREAEEYIVGWARELSADQPIKIVVHVPESEAQRKSSKAAVQPAGMAIAVGFTAWRWRSAGIRTGSSARKRVEAV